MAGPNAITINPTQHCFFVRFDYEGSRWLSCEVEPHCADDRIGAALQVLTSCALPAEFIDGNPVYWSFDSHGRWAQVTDDQITFGRTNKRYNVYSVRKVGIRGKGQ